MTLGELREHTSALLKMSGDAKLPDNDVYIPILHQAMVEIANETYPLTLITTDNQQNILREFQYGMYVREPERPALDTDTLDLDTDLCFAASNLIASKFARDPMVKQSYSQEAYRAIDAYSSNVYTTLQLHIDDEAL